MKHTPMRQQGVTLMMALIMLALLTMLALTSFNLGKSNLLIVNNMQHRDEVLAAAKEVMEDVLTTPRFTENPASFLIGAPCVTGQQNSRCIDNNGDNVADVNVVVANATCQTGIPIKTSTLDPAKAEDNKCMVGDSTGSDAESESVGNSMCSDSLWELRATATDIKTEATVTVLQGVKIRVLTANFASACATPPVVPPAATP